MIKPTEPKQFTPEEQKKAQIHVQRLIQLEREREWRMDLMDAIKSRQRSTAANNGASVQPISINPTAGKETEHQQVAGQGVGANTSFPGGSVGSTIQKKSELDLWMEKRRATMECSAV